MEQETPKSFPTTDSTMLIELNAICNSILPFIALDWKWNSKWFDNEKKKTRKRGVGNNCTIKDG